MGTAQGGIDLKRESSGRTIREENPAVTVPSIGISRDDRKRAVREQQLTFRNILQGVLKNEVIPRVFDANGPPQDLPAEIDSENLSQDVRAFQEIMLAGDYPSCFDFVKARIDGGASLRALCLGLFTTTAREFGERWLRDEISFVDVTTGLGTLHVLLHQLSARDPSIGSAGGQHNIILASSPTEQHSFGILIVSKIFEMEGWLVTGGPELHTGEDLNWLVGKTWFDIIGLTASTEEGAYGLEDEIERLREASLNPSVRVMVGGNGFANHPGISRIIRADELAMDAEDAIVKARAFLRDRKSPAQD